MNIDISIILAGIAFLEASTSVVWHCVTQKNIKKMEQTHEKELLKLKQDYEAKMHKLKTAGDQLDHFETSRINAVTGYLSAAGSYLANTYSNEAYTTFAQSVSQIFMYLPKERHDKVKELNEMIYLVRSIRKAHEDNAYARGEAVAQRAEEFRCQLCEEFSDLGIKPPQAK